MSTKIHAVCDALGNPVAFNLTPGLFHDLDNESLRGGLNPLHPTLSPSLRAVERGTLFN